MDNVNNLNGVPNFGHGHPENNMEPEIVETTPEAAPAPEAPVEAVPDSEPATEEN